MNKKILSLLMSIVMMLTLVPTVPQIGVYAEGPDKSVTEAYANLWVRSALRSHMNGVPKDNNGSLPLNTTHETRQTSGYYESRFTDKEFDRILPFTYETNVFEVSETNEPELNGTNVLEPNETDESELNETNLLETCLTNASEWDEPDILSLNETNMWDLLVKSSEVRAVYKTTDKFWLPSGNFGKKVVSWGSEDISSDVQYRSSKINDKRRMIPISYWCRGNSIDGSRSPWLRSSYSGDKSSTLFSRCGELVDGTDVDSSFNTFGTVLKMHLKSIIFSSVASAGQFTKEGGAKKNEIEGCEDFGERSYNEGPDYGMYFKTQSDKPFTADSISLSRNTLTVDYTGGEPGQYVMVQAFKEDDLEEGTMSYDAAKRLSSGTNGSVSIDVSDWDLDSFNGYTIKVWMEENFRNLSPATMPVTFVGTTEGTMKTESGQVTNLRVFALKKDLQCSWGDLSELSDSDYDEVISGFAATETGKIMGKNATNQKIYYGGMQFWIAGREKNGEIDLNGDVMTLYQAKNVEARQFNDSKDNYFGKPPVKLHLTRRNFSGARYSEDEIITENLDEGTTYNWQYKLPGIENWIDGMPPLDTTCELRCFVEGTDNYERTYSNIVNFIGVD